MATVSITEAWLRKNAADEAAGKPAALPPGKERERYFDDARGFEGFGVVIGKRFATFFVRGRVDGIDKASGKPKTMQRDIKIGHWNRPGAGDDRSQLWTEARARKKAQQLLGTISAGEDPVEEARAPSSGPTLRDGVSAHLARMKKKNRAERSIGTFTHETSKYLGDWLDTPINDLDVEAIVDQVKAGVQTRRNSLNAKGAAISNRVIAHISASWRSLNRNLKGALGNWNPTASTDKDKLKPKRQRIPEEVMPDWAARVATMRSPIRRDGLMLALHTGLRHEDVRSIRHEDVDLEKRTLTLPDPKGGEAKSFTIPLSTTPLEILRRRRKQNATDLGRPDGGWAFPGINHAGETVAIDNLRQMDEGGRFPVEDVHTLRRTWESIAHEEGVSELDQHVLSNHSFGSHNVNATYIAQHIDHLAKCAAKIEAGIARRIKGAASKRRASTRR